MDSYTLETPLGPVTLRADSTGLTSVEIDSSHPVSKQAPAPGVLADATEQLREYFAGQRKTFDLPVSFKGTPFQEAIWNALLDIPYGEVLSYGELGAHAGRPGAARAVGGAVGANPIPIIIPCHRVMGSTGRITGYSGGNGIPTKKMLLDLEGIDYRN